MGDRALGKATVMLKIVPLVLKTLAQLHTIL